MSFLPAFGHITMRQFWNVFLSAMASAYISLTSVYWHSDFIKPYLVVTSDKLCYSMVHTLTCELFNILLVECPIKRTLLVCFFPLPHFTEDLLGHRMVVYRYTLLFASCCVQLIMMPNVHTTGWITTGIEGSPQFFHNVFVCPIMRYVAMNDASFGQDTHNSLAL